MAALIKIEALDFILIKTLIALIDLIKFSGGYGGLKLFWGNKVFR